MKVVVENLPARSKLGVLARLVAFVGLVAGVLGGMTGLYLYVALSQDVPTFHSLADYRPKTVTRVYSKEGQLIGEYFREKRLVVPYERIPRRLIQAVLASEDDRFFEHQGIDYVGILRAAYANVLAGRIVQGGSTITQQVAKALLISAEGYKEGSAKKLSRKVKEAILARRLEQTLSKQDILTLYLNHIFLGNQAYGVEAAAQNYFRKHVEDLTLAEAALLAGLPQAPSSYSPITYPAKAKARREYVLQRMLDEGLVSKAEVEEAKNEQLVVHRAPNYAREYAPYYAEHVRKLLVEQYGEATVLDEGLEVHTSVDVERSIAAEAATYLRLRQVDRRQGYKEHLAQLGSPQEIDEFLKKYTAELARIGRAEKLELDELYVAVVTKVDAKDKNLELRIGPHKAVLPLAGMRWARPINPQKWFEASLITEIPRSFVVGSVIEVRTTKLESFKQDRFATQYLKTIPSRVQLVELEQPPSLEAALLSTEVESGYVTAMIGGYSFDKSEFNRAIQACRQPGSCMKPIVYAAALDLKGYTQSTTVLDAPLTFDDPEAKKRWKPTNFGEKFLGEVTLRTALQNSMNIPAVRVAMAVGLPELLAYAKKLGVKTDLPAELGVALGQGCVTMLELAEVYRLFANYGERRPQIFITRVVDRDGKVLFDQGWYADPWIGWRRRVARGLDLAMTPRERVIDPEIGFLITKMMRNVVTGGTGTPAQALGIPVAGKTGTTNDSFDAWFIGFTTELVTAAWVGYDDYVVPMGKYEQGGRAALPLWLSYMRRALKGRRTGEFEPPPGVELVRIDPSTGLLAKPGAVGSVMEAYRKGTEPTEYATEAGHARPNEFFKEDNL